MSVGATSRSSATEFTFPYTSDPTLAADSPAGSAQPYFTAWWTFTLTEESEVALDLFGSTRPSAPSPGPDTMLYVYNGTAIVIYNDDVSGRSDYRSGLTATLPAGTYHVAAGLYDSSTSGGYADSYYVLHATATVTGSPPEPPAGTMDLIGQVGQYLTETAIPSGVTTDRDLVLTNTGSGAYGGTVCAASSADGQNVYTVDNYKRIIDFDREADTMTVLADYSSVFSQTDIRARSLAASGRRVFLLILGRIGSGAWTLYCLSWKLDGTDYQIKVVFDGTINIASFHYGIAHDYNGTYGTVGMSAEEAGGTTWAFWGDKNGLSRVDGSLARVGWMNQADLQGNIWSEEPLDNDLFVGRSTNDMLAVNRGRAYFVIYNHPLAVGQWGLISVPLEASSRLADTGVGFGSGDDLAAYDIVATRISDKDIVYVQNAFDFTQLYGYELVGGAFDAPWVVPTQDDAEGKFLTALIPPVSSGIDCAPARWWDGATLFDADPRGWWDGSSVVSF